MSKNHSLKIVLHLSPFQTHRQQSLEAIADMMRVRSMHEENVWHGASQGRSGRDIR